MIHVQIVSVTNQTISLYPWANPHGDKQVDATHS